MSLFDLFKPADPDAEARQEASRQRLAGIEASLRTGAVPAGVRARLEGARAGRLPWTATLTPAELMAVRSHGLRPVASVSATCWMHYGYSWTQGHAQGWESALKRLRAEAKAASANVVLDVKMRTLRLGVENSMDFTLVGTAAYVEDLPPSPEPIVATVPALEFVKLLEADVVPTGIAIGAQYEWLTDQYGTARQDWMGNTESTVLSGFWDKVRRSAHAELRRSAATQGNGVLAHVNFGQMFEVEREKKPRQYLARHIIVATTVDARRGAAFPHEVQAVVDMRAGATPLKGGAKHHQSYGLQDREGAI